MQTPVRRVARLSAPLLAISAVLGACAGPGSPPGRAPSAAATAPSAAPDAVPAMAPASSQARASRALRRVAHRFHAHLGVYVLDTGTGRTVTYRADERFAYCSTFKVLAAGILLQRDTEAQLSHVITYRGADLVYHSPVTARHAGTGMTLRALIAAAVQYSDNTAANLLLRQLGGPRGLQAALRGLGDSTTDADRSEPALSDAIPGDIRDTSTPRALGTDLRLLVLGQVLSPGRRQVLTSLLLGNTTGGPYIRAGVPAGWKVGDKTGNGGWGTRNDIAIAWPPGRAPVVISVLSRRSAAHAASDDALIADATAAALAALGYP
jgi:beta-lactamase class A